MSLSAPSLSTLRRLRPLAQFTDEQLQSLANRLSIQSASKNEKLIELGCTEEYSLFILSGEIKTIARDGAVKLLSFNESDELNPFAQLRPSMYDVITTGPVDYLKIDKDLLNDFARQTESGDEDISVHALEDEDSMNPCTVHLYQDLMLDSIKLPSLPEVAQRIQTVFHDDNSGAEDLAGIIMTDPAITGKLIKIANSPVYQGVATTNTLQAAVVRLGMETTCKLVMAYAANELFKSQSQSVIDRMEKLWTHSRKVAAISRVLAQSSGLFDPEQAMLAGLMHDLGVIVIVEYLQQHESSADSNMIEDTIKIMRPQVTGLLMRKWNFSDEMVTVAEESEQWFRNARKDADLCDLVIVAQYHSLMGSTEMGSMPPISTIPAFSKFNMGPKESIELMKQSNKQISEIERMLQL